MFVTDEQYRALLRLTDAQTELLAEFARRSPFANDVALFRLVQERRREVEDLLHGKRDEGVWR